MNELSHIIRHLNHLLILHKVWFWDDTCLQWYICHSGSRELFLVVVVLTQVRQWCSCESPTMEHAHNYSVCSIFWEWNSQTRGMRIQWFSEWLRWCHGERQSALYTTAGTGWLTFLLMPSHEPCHFSEGMDGCHPVLTPLWPHRKLHVSLCFQVKACGGKFL